MILTIEYLRQLGNQPRLHGNGFIQLDVGEGKRLHVWDPELQHLKQKQDTNIHDHTFDFESYVLLGQLIHTVYDVEYNVAGPYHVYEAIPRDRQDTEMVNSELTVACKNIQQYRLEMDSKYSFPAFKFHESAADNLTMTLMVKTKKHSDVRPRVLCPMNAKPDNEFNRYNVDVELLWKSIREAINCKTLLIQNDLFIV